MLFIHFKTLFSFKFYHRLAQLSKWYVLGFVFYLFCVSVLVLFFFTGSLLKNNLPVFLKNFPQITFEKGILTQPQKPVEAPIPNSDFKIVFDASAKMPPSAETLIQDKVLAWVHHNQVYIPSASGLQIQELPTTLNFTSTPQAIEKYQPTLFISLRIAFFLTSILILFLFLAFAYCLALGILYFFNMYKGRPLPQATLVKLAAFLLGPLATLLLIHLWITIPLFSMAQFILCMIYVQQIFNTLPETSHEN